MEVVLVIALLVLFVGYILYNMFDMLGLLIGGFLPLAKKYRVILDQQFAFYQTLQASRKWGFEKRVKNFMEDKDFGGHGIEVTDEMRVLISAAAVQLTFGLPKLLLIHFTKVVIHPDQYYSARSMRDHVGEVNLGFKAIVVSWKHFMQGYEHCCDGRNLGLHEMAHALWLEDTFLVNAEDDFFDTRTMERWNELASEEIERIRNGRSRFFRDYAGTDHAEFFAVAVEYFFEQPAEYRAKMPDVYAAMCGLLRQDPLAQ